MRKIVKEINIFNFDELKPEVQNKLINDFRETLVNDNFELLYENYIYILKENYNLCDYEIEYSLSYSQGDGFCFYSNRYNLLSYTILNNKDVKNANVFEKYLIENNLVNDILLNYLNDGYNLGIFKGDRRYTHARTCYIDYEFNDDKQETIINDYIVEIKNKLYDVYINVCREMERIGYSCYDVPDEDVKEDINANGYEFLENGEIYQE